MDPIYYIDRMTGQKHEEKVFWGGALGLLYGTRKRSRLVGRPLKHLVARWPIVSKLCGYWQRRPRSSKNIGPFIETYGLDTSEFVQPIEHFQSFNEFFIRQLKPEARPISSGKKTAIIPADGRFYFFQDIERSTPFVVKGQEFNLSKFLNDEALAKQYAGGSMVLARLCPMDYHRFHFPVSGIPSKTHPISGPLYSVNPWALRDRLHIFWTNKRVYCQMQSDQFGDVLLAEVGATTVGTIHQTYQAFAPYCKGDEKGYFSFGGSTLILLFLPGAIRFDEDLLQASRQGLEILCRMGQSMGIGA